jgi:hypothetical protein
MSHEMPTVVNCLSMNSALTNRALTNCTCEETALVNRLYHRLNCVKTHGAMFDGIVIIFRNWAASSALDQTQPACPVRLAATL